VVEYKKEMEKEEGKEKKNKMKNMIQEGGGKCEEGGSGGCEDRA
jgi:hypothetical protein